MSRLIRVFPAGLEVRADLRTIIGLACPFDAPTEVRDFGGGYTEMFRRGAFARSIAERGPERVKVLAWHNWQNFMPIGRASLLREDAAGLYAELRVSMTPTGDEVLELVRDGTLDGLSIGFEPVAEDRVSTRGVVVRTEVKLREVSVCAQPCYDTARVAGVRTADSPDPLTELELWRARLAADHWS